MSVTIKDIARIAGVSHTTVLKALHNKPKISPQLREKILQIAKDNNYTLNTNASNLALKTTNVIGIVVTDISIPLFAEMVRMVERVADRYGYRVVVSSSDYDPDREMEAICRLHQMRVAGIIIAPTYEETEFVDYLKNTDIPFLVLGRLEGLDIDYITFDDFSATYKAAVHLISQGHKRIALAIHGEKNIYPYRYWLEGYQAALSEYGIPYDEKLILTCKVTPADGYEAAGRVLRMEREPTALISCSDMVVPGILRRVYEEGKRIPQDLSLSVIQDEPAFEYYIPKVTAVRYPNEKLGRLSAEFLFRKIQEAQQKSQENLEDQEHLESLEHHENQEHLEDQKYPENKENSKNQEHPNQQQQAQLTGIKKELLEVELIERESTGRAVAQAEL